MPPNSTDKVGDLRSEEVLLPQIKVESQKMEIDTKISFRTSLPQVLATMAQSMLLFSLGMLVAVPTVVIPAVTNNNITSCSNVTFSGDACLKLTPGEASTFAGLVLIMQPIGSLLSGVVSEMVGRKLCMLLVNVPELFGWLLLFYSTRPWHLFAAAVSMGFSIGFMEAPTLSYVGEIAQPHMRGTLASFTSVFISVGTLLMYTMGTFLHWKTVMAISISVPVVTMLAIFQIPESPLWLLLKGREKEAQKSLCWLRGWTTPECVSKELNAMREHAKASKLNAGALPGQGTNESSTTKITLKEKLKDLTRPAMIKPLSLVITYFAFMHFASLNGARPYLVGVYTRLGVAINPYLGTVFGAISQIMGVVMCMIMLRRVGKRKLSLITMLIASIINMSLGVYSLLYEKGYVYVSWLPLVLMASLSFTTHLGIGIIPWTLLSEVFPPRGRSIGGGLSAASSYIIWFMVTKTWLHLQSVIQLYGMFFLYSSLGFLGTVFLYVCLPETEGKTLQDIEGIFKNQRLRRKKTLNLIG